MTGQLLHTHTLVQAFMHLNPITEPMHLPVTCAVPYVQG